MFLFSLAFFYLLAIVALSTALGIQIILLPWLVVDHLALSSVGVGWVQAAVLIPNVLLLLIGGATADRGKGTRWLVPLLVLGGLVHLGLALIINNGWLSLSILLAYASFLGAINAFVQPWREYLLKKACDYDEQLSLTDTSSHSPNTYPSNSPNTHPSNHPNKESVAHQTVGADKNTDKNTDEGADKGVDGKTLKTPTANLQRWIAKSSLSLYAGQAMGVAIAGLSNDWGVETILIIQVVMILLALCSFAYVLRRLPMGKVCVSTLSVSSKEYLLTGFNHLWQSPALRTLLVIVAFNGFFHIGVFIVSLPLLVQQVYGETVDFYSHLQLTFVVGMVVTTLVVIMKGALDSPGRRIIFSLLYGGIILLAVSAGPTLIGLFILLFSWGVVVGISSNMGRTVLQALAPEESRGRMIAIYQLALFGFAPLGALFAGYVVELWGVMSLLKISGWASVLLFVLTLGTRALWDVQIIAEVSTKEESIKEEGINDDATNSDTASK